jgi:hypothetical protein
VSSTCTMDASHALAAVGDHTNMSAVSASVEVFEEAVQVAPHPSAITCAS